MVMKGNTANRAEIPLYLFAKAPRPGQVKTRLQPNLTPDQCAELAVMMLKQSMAKVASSWPGRRVLTVTPDADHPVFLELVDEYGFETRRQSDGNLGHRLWDVLEEGLKGHGAAMVMGCDVPHISVELLSRACQDLQQGQNVIGPARDGGFYFLGLGYGLGYGVGYGVGEGTPALFDQVRWGTGDVLNKVLDNALDCQLDLVQYPLLRDIDLWDDLQWLARQDSQYAVFTPA